ncbi:hypothetical protein Dimus_003713 [Dionaea muscipula]
MELFIIFLGRSATMEQRPQHMLAIEDSGLIGESDGSRLTAALFRQRGARAAGSDEKDCVRGV